MEADTFKGTEPRPELATLSNSTTALLLVLNALLLSLSIRHLLKASVRHGLGSKQGIKYYKTMHATYFHMGRFDHQAEALAGIWMSHG